MHDAVPMIVAPSYIQEVLNLFDGRQEPFHEMELSGALSSVRKPSNEIAQDENTGAWAECLAFLLTPSYSAADSPWGTYLGPTGSATTAAGQTVYFPSLDGVDERFIAYWARRANSVQNPVLKARYSDLGWDLTYTIAGKRPDIAMARGAIDAYLDSVQLRRLVRDIHAFGAVKRALDIAAQIKDATRAERARTMLLALHREEMDKIQSGGRGMWWQAVGRLLDDKAGGTTPEERAILVADLEIVLALRSDSNNPKTFDPYDAKAVGDFLIAHFQRQQNGVERNRVFGALGQAYEAFAARGDAMLAVGTLQDSVDFFRRGGMAKDAKRARRRLQERVKESRGFMKEVVFSQEISRDEFEEWLNEMCKGDPWHAMQRIATNHVVSKEQMQDFVNKAAQSAPLFSRLTKVVHAADHVAGKIGPVGQDEMGPLLMQASRSLQIDSSWLFHVLNQLIKLYGVDSQFFVDFINRNELFEDTSLLSQGIQAWFEEDHVKAFHVLMPQIESAVREVVSELGEPVTKPRSQGADADQSITMGDALHNETFLKAIGGDLRLHLLALYVDPRGWNLRNRFAHGLMHADEFHEGLTIWLIQTLAVLGDVKADDSSGG